jgi:hypothetical protein
MEDGSLVDLTALWHFWVPFWFILWSFWYIFTRFGILYQEQSGNPDFFFQS